MVSRKAFTAGLVFLPLFATLIALGTWQVQRLHWKNALIANLTAGLNAPAITITGDDAPPEFTHVHASGTLLSGKPLLLYARTKDGVAGVHVFAVLLRARQAPILIDRGFLPLLNTRSADSAPLDAARATAPSRGEIDGIVRLSTHKAWFEPENDLGRDEWYWPDLPAMAAKAGADTPTPYYIEVVAPTAEDGPVPTGADILPNIRNEHLQYAITWYSLAAVLAVIFAISMRQKQ